MKNLNILTYLLFLGLLVGTSCKKDSKAAKAGDAVKEAVATSSSTSYKIDPNASSVSWTGSKVVGDKHQGKFKIMDGSISVKDGNIEAGSFVIDMNSLTVTDLEGDMKGKLEGHMKSADFFDTATHSKGTFTVTGSQKVTGTPNVSHKITGNLKLKNVSKSVSFNADLNIGKAKFAALTPSFNINRNDWGIVYNNKTIAGVAKEYVINDDVSLIVNLSGTAN